MRRLRVAVVGAGAIGVGTHLPALRAMENELEIVALVDIDTTHATAVAGEWAIPDVYRDTGAMLAESAPDLVVVGTPPGTHEQIVVAALDAGAWVWCEKPPMLSLDQYDAIAAHEGARGPFAGYVFQQRFGSAARRLRRHVEEGTLGRPMIAVCNTLWHRTPEYFAAPWRGRWETEGGGPTMGHGIHQMDLAMSILGDWAEVTAVMSTLAHDTRTEDVSMAIVRMESGALCTITNSLLSPRESSQLRFDFDDATVELEHLYGYDNSHWSWTPAAHVTDPAVVESWLPTSDDASTHLTQLRGFIASMRAGVRPAASGDDGRRALELVAGMYASALGGRTVRRDELRAGHAFRAAMHGGDPLGATEALAAGRLRAPARSR